MFTGLVETVGQVVSLQKGSADFRLGVRAEFSGEALALGESIAVNGVCLTLVEESGGAFVAQVSPETMGRSTLERLRVGSRVNLERALRVGDRLGGHMVLGHVDGTAEVVGLGRVNNAVVAQVRVPQAYGPYVVEKGSVALDGVSLTVSELEGQLFKVVLVPFSVAKTTLSALEVGQWMNLEVDVIGKYVARMLGIAGQGSGPSGGRSHGLDMAFLQRHGFGGDGG